MEDNETKSIAIVESSGNAEASVSEIVSNDTVMVKPQKTLEEQIAILKSRKLFIEDDTKAISILEQCNYYRLRGYYIHLQEKNSDDFKPGVSFSFVSALHDFDNELRILLLRLLLDIEVVARARIAYSVAHAWGPMGYRNLTYYGESCDQEKFMELMTRIDSDLANSRERFIDTYKKKYAGQFPIWVVVEVMSFGDLSKLYHLLPTELKKNIAKSYDCLDEALLTNWIQCAAMLRNLCAHNSRLYARNIPTPITIEKEKQEHISKVTDGLFKVYPQTLFAYLLALRRISNDSIWNSFEHDFEHLIQKYDCFVELNRLGMPKQWKQFLFEK